MIKFNWSVFSKCSDNIQLDFQICFIHKKKISNSINKFETYCHFVIVFGFGFSLKLFEKIEI